MGRSESSARARGAALGRLVVCAALWVGLWVGLWATSTPASAQERAALGPVKVYVLAGQSNMEGKAQNKLWERQARAEATAAHFAHLRRNGQWIVRDDAFIRFLERSGNLTLGYGSPERTGVELELGTVLAERYDEPVLLIKAAWGGHSLARQFRPPSAGLPSTERLSAELARARQRVEEQNAKNGQDDPLPTLESITEVYGASYRKLLAEVRDTLARRDKLFPSLAGRELQLAGCVWFQGWNDQYEGFELEYAANMAHFIRDVRRDLGAPNLPFVIGVMGQNGSQPAQGALLAVQTAQLAMNDVPEFAGNVRALRTDVLVDAAAEAQYPTWKADTEAWEQVGSDHPYHYLGSAIWFTRIGRAFGEALLELAEG